MGSLVEPTLANLFLFCHQLVYLVHCPLEFKSVVYRRYVDDTFLLFRSRERIKKFFKYVNCQHSNIKFTFKGEENNAAFMLILNALGRIIAFLLYFIVSQHLVVFSIILKALYLCRIPLFYLYTFKYVTI